MLGIYELYYNVNITIGDHDGYCSGGDCEDIDEEINDCAEIVLSKKNSKLFNYLTHNLTLPRLNLLLDLYHYFHFEVKISSTGSGFCGPSPSGLHHEYIINRSILKQVKFSTYVLNSKRLESYNLTLKLEYLRRKLYTLLFSLKKYKIVKDMRIAIVNIFLKSISSNAYY